MTVDPLVLANPSIAGGSYVVFWSEVEKAQGQFEWAKMDASIAEWKAAGKGVSICVMWSASGYWRNPAAKTPTPQWVWDAGAKFALHSPSGTEVPLFWDPIYLKHAHAFLDALAAKYNRESAVFYIDATPGAETNPYRFGTIDLYDPGFRGVFTSTKASDGTTYTDALWGSALHTYITTVRDHFQQPAISGLPVLITLNKGAMPGSKSRTQEIGDLVVSSGMWVGQAGLKGGAYTGRAAVAPWLKWGASTKVFFETASAAIGATGTMQELVDACQRAGCNWLNVYAVDGLRATPGTRTYDHAWDAALDDLAATVGQP
jgi:hypothetical protein